MYRPTAFVENDRDTIARMIRAHPFGQLITCDQGRSEVTHLPFMLHWDKTIQGQGQGYGNSKGKLISHIARANPQWQHFAHGEEVLVVFQGPHTYISPSWYKNFGVPTWNYAAVHVRGTVRLIEDEARLIAMLTELTEFHEAARSEPWVFDIDPERRAHLMTMLIGFEIDITDIQATFKFNQNRSEEDRAGVIAALSQSPDANDQAVARLMREQMKPQKKAGTNE
jgi:transcriptional regulator